MTSPPRTGSTLDSIPLGSRIAIVRLRSLGDCVLTTPALQVLAESRPDLEIGVVVENRFAAVFEGNPAVSVSLAPSYGEIFRWHPRLCLNLHGGTRSQLLTLASRARVRAGFGHHHGSAIYDVKIPRAQEILGTDRTVNTAEQLATAMFHLGVPIVEVPRARLFAERLPAARPYAVIHPMAAASYKTWRPEGFLEVARHIERDGNLEPVFVGADGDDLKPFGRYRLVSGAPLRHLKSLIGGATVFVGNDSGPAHIACALGVPVVVLFGRIEHRIVWAPWRPVAARTLVSPDGIAAIEAAEVIGAVSQLLGRNDS